MLALEVVGILGASYAVLVYAVLRTKAAKSDVRQKKATPATTGGAW